MSITILCTYKESTSDASDTSPVTAVSGSPPRSRKAHSDEDNKRILSWAEDVASSDSDDSDLHAVCPLVFQMLVIVIESGFLSRGLQLNGMIPFSSRRL